MQPVCSGLGPAARFVLGRENNVVRVDFRHEPDPPAPKFPGAGAMRLPSFDCDVECVWPYARERCGGIRCGAMRLQA